MAYTTIDKPTDYFNTVLITGDATDPRSVTGYGFAPDFIWAKMRSGNADHGIFDKVRGATKFLYANKTDAEGTTVNTPTSFDSDGFTIGDDNSNFYYNGSTFAYWGWRADGTSGSSNTDGSITSTVSANTTSGFSIVSYTGNATAGATVGHGLGSTPSMIIVKGRNKSGGSPWWVYHSALGNTKGINLNNTNAEATFSVLWNNTSPTSSVFSLGTGDEVNQSGTDFIAYCFAEKKGFSKFGSYTGNGSTDGTFVYTGFKPAFVIQKNASVTQGWQLQDNKRLGYNPDNYLLQPHTSQAESALQRVDLLSNGFKVRTTDAGQNASGNTYIYMAFAESPFTTSTGIPTTAR